MTAPTVRDVNAEFNNGRAKWIADAPKRQAAAEARVADDRARFEARVTAGKLIPLGGNRFRVNDPGSYDDRETWYLNTNAAGQELFLPEHQLDTSRDGKARLYSTAPAWHGLGTIIPGGLSDVGQVMKLAGLDFEVVKQPQTYTWNRKNRRMTDRFDIIRTDTGYGLSNVGTRYTPLQNHEAFTFLQQLVDDKDVVWESAGALRDGRKVFISMKLPESLRIDPDGVNDEIVPFLVAVNSFDGQTMFRVVVTPWRPVCGNTERFALRDATASWGVRHTTNAKTRIDEARRTLGLTVDYFDSFAREENVLAQTTLEIDAFLAVIEELFPTPDEDEAKRTMTSHKDRVEDLTNRWVDNVSRLGKTAYAAERAITEHLDWGQRLNPQGSLKAASGNAVRATQMIEGANDKEKTAAHRRLLLRTVR